MPETMPVRIPQARNRLLHPQFGMEARVGIEPLLQEFEIKNS